MGRRTDTGRGPTQRQLKVGETVRRTLADALVRGDIHEPGLMSASITVSEVRMSPDLRHATVFVMPLGGRNVDETMEALNRARGQLRRAVDRGAELRFSPSLEFRLDESYDRMDATRRMLDQPAVRRDLDHEVRDDGAGQEGDRDEGTGEDGRDGA